MHKKPPVSELEFIRIVANHRDFSKKLLSLDLTCRDLAEYVRYVASSWFRLAEAHLKEARIALDAGSRRSALSRSYYAAYNASKCVRYVAQGSVSLKGDDHGKASSELPGDFPDTAFWARTISVLYENRLRADYDNWQRTRYDYTLKPTEAIDEARKFLAVARKYLRDKHGLTL